MKRLNWKHEWHLYSAVAIVASLTFLVIQFYSGTSQSIGMAFSALVGTFLFTSDSWKKLPTEIHQWSILLSLLVTVLVGFVLCFINNKNTHK